MTTAEFQKKVNFIFIQKRQLFNQANFTSFMSVSLSLCVCIFLYKMKVI